MDILRALEAGPLFFDGAMGTLLQAAGLPMGELPERWVLTHPDVVRDIHRDYFEAGAHIVKTCTFGNNAHKLDKAGLDVEEVAARAVALAREAADAKSGRFVALDIGPIGRLLAPLGDLAFEDAVALFAACICGGAKGADMVLIETMTDAYELKAAVLAAKENCSLPVCATVSPDAQGRMFTGMDIEGVVALLEGLRVDALGLNCGRGPEEMLPIVERMAAASSLPIICNPNAGMPKLFDNVTHYDLAPEAFAVQMRKIAQAGAHLLGGCCGTTPAHIAALVRACGGMKLAPVTQKNVSVVTGYGRTVRIEGAPVLIGERINPTGKPKLKEALRAGDYELILREAVKQQACGAELLDVNAGLPDIDEAAVLASITQRVQSVCALPLQLDTASPEALARALRLYNGKPMINSVNGGEASMAAVFPLVQKYGGMVVALTLDEAGIPEDVEGRMAIARRIIERAAQYGVAPKDILIDTLTMTAGASDKNARVTLETLRRVRAELGVHTVLGVSNISFGLPERELLNATFFTMAAQAGLSAAIVNPYAKTMMDAMRAARALLGADAGCSDYIAAYAGEAAPLKDAPQGALSLKQCIIQGLAAEAAQSARGAKDALAAIDAEVIPALDSVGEAYGAGKLFLPGLLMSADAAKAALAELCPPGTGGERGEVLLATVQGDVHDIGKNIVGSVLSSYRFHVVDMGRDVPPEAVLAQVRAQGITLVGLSALMTTTVQSMRSTVALLKRELPACRIMVGGAVLTASLAADMGADRYVRDAMESVRYAQEVLG